MALPFYFILVYFYNTHEVIVGLPQGIGGLAILFYLFYIILVYFHITHQVLVGLLQVVGGLAIYNVSFWFFL
jgi:hypothetical protein